MDKVRVLRVVEYVGSRAWIEEVMRGSIQGTKVIASKAAGIKGVIRAATIGDYPEILEEGEKEDG